jgi:threonine dehydrogenase-like Zn-dependent dehydrogenase
MKNAFGKECRYGYEPGRALLHEASAVVVRVGSAVHEVTAGDLVVANPLFPDPDGIGFQTGAPQCDGEATFASIQKHGFAREFFLYPAALVHKVNPDKTSPALAALAEPLACVFQALEGYGAITKRIQARSLDAVGPKNTSYNYTVLILGGGALGMTTALVAKYLGAKEVIVLDRNRSKTEKINSLGDGIRGLCIDWEKTTEGREREKKCAELHEVIREVARGNFQQRKGVDMLVNCVDSPQAISDHLPALYGSPEPVVIQAGGSQGGLELSAPLFRKLMTQSATMLWSYRYSPASLRTAIHFLEQAPDEAAKLLISLTGAWEQQNQGALQAFNASYTRTSGAGKYQVAFSRVGDLQERFEGN